MQNYNQFKVSPKTGKRIYSSTEIANEFGISANLLNKLLIKYNILTVSKNKNQYYELKDKSLGEECHYNVSHCYDSYRNDNTTNVTIKFSTVGKKFIDNLLINKLGLVSKNDKQISQEVLEKYFPAGRFALSVRKSGTMYNPDPDGPSMLYISYRTNRNDSSFNRNYMYISDEDAETIRKDIKEWGKNNNYDTKGYKMPIDNSEIATKIINWKEKYFNSVVMAAGYTFSLSKDQVQKNKNLILKELKG